MIVLFCKMARVKFTARKKPVVGGKPTRLTRALFPDTMKTRSSANKAGAKGGDVRGNDGEKRDLHASNKRKKKTDNNTNQTVDTSNQEVNQNANNQERSVQNLVEGVLGEITNRACNIVEKHVKEKLALNLANAKARVWYCCFERGQVRKKTEC